VLHRKPCSIEEVAAALGVGRSTVYDSIRRGDFPLPVIRIGARVLVSRTALERLLSAHQGATYDAA
jgi:excisionase family DNA binding protein